MSIPITASFQLNSSDDSLDSKKLDSDDDALDAILHYNPNISPSVATSIYRPLGIYGFQTELIRKTFNDFRDFKDLKGIKSVGQKSRNGLIMELEMQKDNLNCRIILKAARKKIGNQNGSDNLYYEYLVGRFLNKYAKRFPCFIETYHLFRYENNRAFMNAVKCYQSQDFKVCKDSLKSMKKLNKTSIKDALLNKDLLALSIQSVEYFEVMKTYLNDIQFIQNELIHVLLQIYLPLQVMQPHFSHNDLHSTNVLLAQPSPSQYLQFTYQLGPHLRAIYKKDTLTFQSKYIAKIIDYGRCFINDPQDKGSYASTPKICMKVASVADDNVQRLQCYPYEASGDLFLVLQIYNVLQKHFPKEKEFLDNYFKKTDAKNLNVTSFCEHLILSLPANTRYRKFGELHVDLKTTKEMNFINMSDSNTNSTRRSKSSKDNHSVKNKLNKQSISPLKYRP